MTKMHEEFFQVTEPESDKVTNIKGEVTILVYVPNA
jgi:hypothetical protein